MMEHAPGPWIAMERDEERDILIVAADGSTVVMVFASDAWGRDVEKTDAEEEANAHLIAAAPDLLRVCREALQAERAYILRMREQVPNYEGSMLMAQLMTVIKKAEGKARL